jgi:hypothetical protein
MNNIERGLQALPFQFYLKYTNIIRYLFSLIHGNTLRNPCDIPEHKHMKRNGETEFVAL